MAAYKYQLSDAQADIGIRNVASVCNDTVQFADLVNRATRRLMKRGDWFGTEQLVKFCIYGCHIVTPRYVGAIRAVHSCAGYANVQNNWYSIIGPAGTTFGRNCAPFAISDDGTTPTYNDITDNTGKLLRYHVVKNNDYGKTITFYGKQYGAQPLQDYVDGAWVMGTTLTAQAGDAQTTTLVTQIDSVVREATQGMTYLYQYDSVTGVLRNLANYEPSETNPSYRKYRIHNFESLPCYTDANGIKVRQIQALVKLQYIPVKVATDFLLIDDLDALALAIQAIKREEAGDDKGAEFKWLSALREMNYGDRDKEGDISIRVRSPGRLIYSPI